MTGSVSPIGTASTGTSGSARPTRGRDGGAGGMNGERSAAGRRDVGGVRGAGADITCGGGAGGSGGGGGATVTGYRGVSDTDPREGATSGATATANTKRHDHATRPIPDPPMGATSPTGQCGGQV